MAKLNKYHKEFIIKQLACYTTPSEVVELVKEEFDVQVSRQQVNYYNPDSAQGKHQLSPKWIQLHDKIRGNFIEGAIQIPIAHKMYRMNELQKLYRRAFDDKDIDRCQALLEQAAKEMGNAFEAMQGKIGELAREKGVTVYQQLNQKFTQINNQSK